MRLDQLKPAKGSVHKEKRIGRGEGSGHGGTSTRGNKGAKSRSGYSKKIGFEGGQMPLYRRIPKFGFTNPNKIFYKAINLDTLERIVTQFDLQEITPEILNQHGLIGKNDKVKILGRGEITKKINVSAHAFSRKAMEAIEKQGGITSII
ncbi:MAG: 50S ribosomal protein L15 [Bacteroidales bacterium]|nr:50S ribosomal protein L15 [Bacteroidales bacterium]